MPCGQGTYGSKVGRPPKKNKKPVGKSGMGMKAYQKKTGSNRNK